MNKISRFIAKCIACVYLFIATTNIAFAQKERNKKVTKEQIEQINKITEPARIKLEEILAKDETYIRYQKDLKALSDVKSLEQRKAMTKKLISNYESFFAKAWLKAAIDEKFYQSKIKAVFPAAMTELISFQSYLGFTITQLTPPTQPAPPPAPRENICINDVCAKAVGEVTGESYLISGRGGTYGKCFVKANAWASIAGGGAINSVLKNNLSIPGDFPQDNRRLSVTIEYDLKIEATAFALIGVSAASASISNRQGEDTDYMMVFAPIIFFNSNILQKSRSDNYIIEKSQLSESKVSAGSSVISSIISASWGNAEANNIRWTICETK